MFEIIEMELFPREFDCYNSAYDIEIPMKLFSGWFEFTTAMTEWQVLCNGHAEIV